MLLIVFQSYSIKKTFLSLILYNYTDSTIFSYARCQAQAELKTGSLFAFDAMNASRRVGGLGFSRQPHPGRHLDDENDGRHRRSGRRRSIRSWRGNISLRSSCSSSSQRPQLQQPAVPEVPEVPLSVQVLQLSVVS